ncbi:MAG TPA: FAD-binding protein, partial [Burkholderiales bacterium]|nr:FAD-binding protein [Burkholderiales bacterium]
MEYDVIVVGAGNAAFAAAVSARDNGAKRVVVLEKAPREKRGGNTHFSGAVFRFTYSDVSELDRFVPNAERDYPGFHKGVQPYPVEAFREDLMKVTQGRSDPELSTLLIKNSFDTMCWIQDVGEHKFELAASVMGVKVGGEF